MTTTTAVNTIPKYNWKIQTTHVIMISPTTTAVNTTPKYDWKIQTKHV